MNIENTFIELVIISVLLLFLKFKTKMHIFSRCFLMASLIMHTSALITSSRPFFPLYHTHGVLPMSFLFLCNIYIYNKKDIMILWLGFFVFLTKVVGFLLNTHSLPIKSEFSVAVVSYLLASQLNFDDSNSMSWETQ